MRTEAQLETNFRVLSALSAADKSDFYSSNGKTWDRYANTAYFYETSDEYKKLLVDEAAEKEAVASSLDDLTPELSAFVLRIEANLEKKRNAPLERNYKTNIGYTYDDRKLGKKVRGYLDLKKASDEDLQSIIDDVPEARKELMYRALIEKNNNTK